ncbi:VOC family protein [Candidatus Pacearchaeota archaeon]|nr:VOC family protein [Candidatus Pacearchaeota archaeon]
MAVQQIFVNLPVKDLQKTKAFFSELGFEFNQKFTDDNAACLIIGEHIFAMLLREEFFKTFTPKTISDAKKNTEVLLALQVESKEEVNEMIEKAIASGGTEPREAQDHGWMFGRSFEDIDGHIWEVFFMDEKNMPKQ